MMVLMNVIGAEQLAKNVVAPGSAVDESNGLMITLIVFLIVNIFALIAKYFFDRALKKQDIKIGRKVSITALAIKTEADLFIKLENLKSFQKSEAHEMLDAIIDIENSLGSSRLFICKDLMKLTNDCLDYFKKVVANFSEKDIRKEKRFTEKFCSLYYGG